MLLKVFNKSKKWGRIQNFTFLGLKTETLQTFYQQKHEKNSLVLWMKWSKTFRDENFLELICLLKYSSDQIISWSYKCPIFLGLNFLEIKNSFTKMILFFNCKNYWIICYWKKTDRVSISNVLIQEFLDFRCFDFCNFRFNAVYNSFLFSSPLVLLSNLDLRGFCFRIFFVSPH